MNEVTLVHKPTVIALAEMTLLPDGLNEMLDWVESYRPECLPEETIFDKDKRAFTLFPHHGKEDKRQLTGNELLVELAGRSCYHSYGVKAGRKRNAEYVGRMLFPETGTMPHASVAYHAKMSFFVAGVSRRLSHELIRHYVGSDRHEEGSPSQESTRYTLQPGFFVVPPYIEQHGLTDEFGSAMRLSYNIYRRFLDKQEREFEGLHGKPPSGKERKRIYEAAAGLLPMQTATSFVWTANPVSLAKMFKERRDEAADLEFQALANQWHSLCCDRWPNLFR